MQNIFVLLLAGKGERLSPYLGDKKQFFRINHRELFLYPLYAAIASKAFSKYLLVHDEEDTARVVKICMAEENKALREKNILLTHGGKDRSESVLLALEFLKDKIKPEDSIFIHDADRVLVTPDFLAEETKAFTKDLDALTPIVPIHDSIIRATRNNMEYQKRDYLYEVQTPQAFRYGKLLSLYENGYDKKTTDDFQKALDNGLVSQTVRGDVRNFKVTEYDDMNLLLSLLQK